MSARGRFGDGRSGYARVRDDWYVEEAAAVAALLRVERFEGRILDPACGGGNIPRICRAHGLDAIGTDRVDRGAPPYCRSGIDFLNSPRRTVENIVCNPPYKHDEAFVLRALERATRKVAMLLRLAFLAGQERHRTIYRPHPPLRIWVFTWRTAMPPGEALRAGRIERKGGQIDYCWIVWQPGHRGPMPPLGWLTP
jgi:hypothetical protein